jgi:hypothetical protein
MTRTPRKHFRTLDLILHTFQLCYLGLGDPLRTSEEQWLVGARLDDGYAHGLAGVLFNGKAAKCTSDIPGYIGIERR